VKLTNPQAALLAELYEHPRHVVDYYPPARVLVRLGLARGNDSQTLWITEAGEREHERRTNAG